MVCVETLTFTKKVRHSNTEPAKKARAQLAVESYDMSEPHLRGAMLEFHAVSCQLREVQRAFTKEVRDFHAAFEEMLDAFVLLCRCGPIKPLSPPTETLNQGLNSFAFSYLPFRILAPDDMSRQQ